VSGGTDGQELRQAFYDAQKNGLKIRIQEASKMQ